MGSEMMDMEQLAAYLQRDVREVGKLASRGHCPGHKVGGEWRFARAEINHWLETQLPAYTEKQLTALEAGGRHGDEGEPLLARPAVGSERGRAAGGLDQGVGAAGAGDAGGAILAGLRSGSDPGGGPPARGDGQHGAAFRRGHPAPAPAVAGGPGRIGAGLWPHGFGHSLRCPTRRLTDIFFLVCCRDDRTHLRVLARLTRLLLRPGFLDSFEPPKR